MIKDTPRRREGMATCVYVIEADSTPPRVKVGISSRPRRRLSDLTNGAAHGMRLVGYWRAGAGRAREIEAQIHEWLKPFRARGEWFKCRTDTAVFLCKHSVAGTLPDGMAAYVVADERTCDDFDAYKKEQAAIEAMAAPLLRDHLALMREYDSWADYDL